MAGLDINRNENGSTGNYLTSTVCQGSMGLHQNNYRSGNFVFNINGSHENVIVEVFRKFRDHCISKFRDGITNSPRHSSTTLKEHSDEQESTAESDSNSSLFLINIDDLPFYCKLIIISKLDTNDICNLSMTSRHWKEVCSDRFLWRELLYRDMIKWHSVGHKSFPLVSFKEFFDVTDDNTVAVDNSVDCAKSNYTHSLQDLHARLCCKKNINYKAMYFHSAYQRHKDAELIGVTASAPSADKEYDVSQENVTIPLSDQQLASNQSFARFIKNLWMKMRSGDGEVIMLGPGMESPNTSKIFRRLLWARPDLLITQRLLPGSQDGVGSGVELDFKGSKRFNLIALYSGNNRERSRRFGLERLMSSNIVEAVEEEREESTTNTEEKQSFNSIRSRVPKFKLKDLVYNFLQQRVNTYRLIYVVDATKAQPASQVSCNRFELEALLEGIRSFENQAAESREQARNEHRHRHASADNAAAALSSIINLPGMSSPNSNPSRRPLLVLCCVKDKSTERIPCVEIANLLDMTLIDDRPWYVHDITVDNLNGLESGLEWLFKQE